MHFIRRTFLMVISLALIASRSSSAADPLFAKEGVAFLQKHCVSCHGANKPKGEVSVHQYVNDLAVLKDRKKWDDILAMTQSGEMPPKDRPRPTAAEIDGFVRSVNGVFDRADKNAKPDPGRVTVRRLNKVEYNNTIRDLLDVDFNASEDFPSDDVGHGFDNIGDVLTLSPILMERYLAAAESISQRAIVVNPAKPPVRALSARYLQPGGANVPQTRFRPITGTGAKGTLSAPFSLTMDGAHIVRVRCYGKQVGDEPVKIALRVGDIELKTFEVTGKDEKGATVFEAKLELPIGNHRASVQFLNGDFKKDDDERTLWVEYIIMEGPIDTRPLSQRKYFSLDAAKAKDVQTREMLTKFLSRAFRRPATADEINRFVKLVEATEAGGAKWEAGMQLAVQAALVSPKFLFRLEMNQAKGAGAAVPLDEYQLASRMSYFIWSTMPDDELRELANKKQLTANIDAQVKRMLKDPRSKALVDNFVMQWLQLRTLKNFAPDATLFPSFNERLRWAMLQETELFFQAIIQEDRSILDILDADFTYMNLSLAKHYGIADTAGTPIGSKKKNPGGKIFKEAEFERVVLANVPGNRGGILTQASVLSVTSNPTRTSPVKRGRWVLEQLLGTPPPPPPPDVPELAADEKAMTSGSLRQRMEQHRSNVACANCHAKMDPLGFAFENYNAIGSFRSKDGEFVIDSSGVLPDGKKFEGPTELKQILKEKKDLFARCLAEKMLIYAVGRGLEYYDKRPIDRISENLAKGDYKFSALVSEIVKSEPFRLRRGGE